LPETQGAIETVGEKRGEVTDNWSVVDRLVAPGTRGLATSHVQSALLELIKKSKTSLS
jgi:hypothetical protein